MSTKKVLAAAIAAIGLSGPLAATAQEPASPIAGNLTLTTNYVVRGLTQTYNKPAVQGTIEYAHPTGLYAGLFASNVSWPGDAWSVDPNLPAGGSAYGGSPSNAISSSFELDIYAGYRGKFLGDFTYDVGAVYYYYPGKYQLDTVYSPGLKKPHTAEFYGALGWKWITGKFYYALTDGVFMTPEAQGTTYLDLTATVPIGSTGFNVVGHVGSWMWAGTAPYLAPYGLKNDVYDLVDYKLGVTKDWSGFTWGAFYWGSTADKTTLGAAGSAFPGVETAVWGNRFGKNIGDDTFFVTLTKAF